MSMSLTDFKEIIENSLFTPSNDDMLYDPKLFERVYKNEIDSLVLLNPTAEKAVVFFHGNHGNVTHYTEKMKRLQQRYQDCDIWCFDYPGFGKSTGRPNATTLVDKAYEFLSRIHSQYTECIWVAETIGACVAIGVLRSVVVNDRKLSLLPTSIVLINTMTSIGHIASDKQPAFVNAKTIVKKLGFELHTAKWIDECREHLKDKMPSLVVVRSRNDDEIPLKHTEAIASACRCSISYVDGNHKNYVY